MKQNEQSFEQAMARLDEISQLLADESTALDMALTLFKEASGLIAYCNKTLGDAKLIIEEYNVQLPPEGCEDE